MVNDNSTRISGTNVSEYICSGVTNEELRFFGQLSFWIGGIVQAIICLIGLCANAISIPVLRSKTLFKSTFNRLLIVLALGDNIYLGLAALEAFRTEMNLSLPLHNTLFVYFLYPIHNIILCLSILMTVILAMERYKAISQPIDYHAIIVSGRQWQRVFRYVIPVTFLSVLFNVPKFFELKTLRYTIENLDEPYKPITKVSAYILLINNYTEQAEYTPEVSHCTGLVHNHNHQISDHEL
jgi:hypothetical protein